MSSRFIVASYHSEGLEGGTHLFYVIDAHNPDVGGPTIVATYTSGHLAEERVFIEISKAHAAKFFT